MGRGMHRGIVLAVGVLLAGVVQGQVPGTASTDVVTGRVTGPDGTAVPGAMVTVVDTVARTTGAARTAADGRYRVEVARGSGHYMVRVQAPGMRVEQRALRRTEDPASLVADFRLVMAAQQVAGVRVVARRPRPSRESGLGDDLSTTGFVPGRLPIPGDATDMASWIGSLPGMALTPGGGFSVLGLSGDANNMTLQGMQLAVGDIPRAGGVFPSVTTNAADPSRGGFSGGLAQMFVPGGSNYRQVTAVVGIEDPALQATDRAAARLGQEFRNVLFSGALAGPIVEDRIYFNSSFQVSRRTSDLTSLLGLDPLALRQVGLSPDSLARFEQLVNGLGVPLTFAGAASSRTTESATWLARFDLSPTGTTAANLVTTVNWGRTRGNGIGTTTPIAAGGDGHSSGASAIYTWSRYYRQAFLQEFKGAAGMSRRRTEPYLDLPAGRVRVASVLPDGASGTTSLTFGGNAGMPDESFSGNWELQSNTSWVSRNERHRVRLASSLQYAWQSQESRTNQLGTWTWNSLDDLARGIPASFTRNLTPRRREGAAWNWFVSLGETWRRSNATSVQGGLRLEGNRFATLPPFNPEVLARFGLRTDRAPNRIHLSPRLGIRHFFNVPTGQGFFDESRIWSLRINVGEYRNMLPASMLAGAFDATGLPTGWRQLSCFGPSAPAPAWDAGAFPPDACLDGTGGTLLTDTQPRVMTWDGDFDAARSWRTSVGLSRVVGPFRTSIDGTWSLTLGQPSAYDHNFAGVARFTLPSEGGRPVFVDPQGIDPRTGATSPRNSRIVDAFGQVNVQRSDLRSESRQVLLSLQPRRFGTSWSWAVTWAQTMARGQQRGFQAAGIGDPRLVEWGPLGFTPRHQVSALFALTPRWLPLRIVVNHRLSSGARFTPVVGGDINGDGIGGDRAFIPDGASDAAVRAGMDALMATAPSYVRSCLRGQAGRFAGLNSCRGPWTQQMGIVTNVLPGRLGVSRRANISMTAWNPLSGIDQLVNGSELKGWGQAGFADPTLLYVRGFDQSTRRYLYEVNPRFGDARAQRTAFRAPFRLSFDVRLTLGPPADRQQLARELSQGRSRQGDRIVAARFKQLYARIPFDPVQTILQLKDSMALTTEQADSLSTMQRRVQDRLEIHWAPTAEWLAGLGERYDLSDALRRVRDTRRGTFPVMVEYTRDVRRLLRDDQLQRMPEFLRQFFDERTLRTFLESAAIERFIGFPG